MFRFYTNYISDCNNNSNNDNNVNNGTSRTRYVLWSDTENGNYWDKTDIEKNPTVKGNSP